MHSVNVISESKLLMVILSAAILIAVGIIPESASAQSCDDAGWSGRFVRPGHMIAYDMEWANGKMYVGGKTFLPVKQGDSWNTVEVYGVFVYDGTSWTYPTIEQGLIGGGSFRIIDIEVVGNDVYVGGSFTGIADGRTIGYLARWDGSDWTAVGSGVNNTVQTITSTGNNDIYIGGQFTMAGGMNASRVAYWSGLSSTWSPLLAGPGPAEGTNSTVYDIAVYNGGVAIAGAFTAAGGQNITRLAHWNWTTGEWSPIGSGTGATPTELLATPSGLYVAGTFDYVDASTTAYGIALWDGGAWQTMGTAQYTDVFDMVLAPSGYLTVAGSFNQTTGVENHKLANWTGSAWEPIDPDCNLTGSNVFAVEYDDAGTLYGRFNGLDIPCGKVSTSLFTYSIGEWCSFGDGISTNAAWGLSLLPHNSDMYVGGLYGWAGGCNQSDGVGRWSMSESKWYPLEQDGIPGVEFAGFDGAVYSLGARNDTIYLGGQFSLAGGVTVSGIAGWDGSQFFSLGNGLSYAGIVHDMAFFQNELYLAGNFYNVANGDASTVSVTGFARWDGSQYHAVPGASFGWLLAAHATSDMLYVGGAITSPIVPSKGIVAYDGSGWVGVGKGVTGRVLAIKKIGSDLFVGGGFQTATNGDDTPVAVYNLARWDGAAWHALGVFNDTVRTIYTRGGELYVGGDFTTVDGQTVNHVARWDGSQWLPLGSGTLGLEFTNVGQVHELNSDGDNLWAVGQFTHAGMVPSSNIGSWTFCTPGPPARSDGDVTSDVTGTSVSFVWAAVSDGAKSVEAITYNLQVADATDFSAPDRDITGIATNSYDLGGLNPETTYSWRVQAVSSTYGDGAWSPRFEFVTGSGSCCQGKVGDASGDGADEPTIGDISIMIDALFINLNWELVPCVAEADINQSGGTTPVGGIGGDITIGDVSLLVDALFITSDWTVLPDCL